MDFEIISLIKSNYKLSFLVCLIGFLQGFIIETILEKLFFQSVLPKLFNQYITIFLTIILFCIALIAILILPLELLNLIPLKRYTLFWVMSIGISTMFSHYIPRLRTKKSAND